MPAVTDCSAWTVNVQNEEARQQLKAAVRKEHSSNQTADKVIRGITNVVFDIGLSAKSPIGI